jgi:hypothetical protein
MQSQGRPSHRWIWGVSCLFLPQRKRLLRFILVVLSIDNYLQSHLILTASKARFAAGEVDGAQRGARAAGLRRVETLAKVEVGRARRRGWLREVRQRLVLLAVVHDPRGRAARRDAGKGIRKYGSGEGRRRSATRIRGARATLEARRTFGRRRAGRYRCTASVRRRCPRRQRAGVWRGAAADAQRGRPGWTRRL